MRVFISVIGTIISVILAYTTLERKVFDRIRIYQFAKSDEEFETKTMSKWQIGVAIALIAIMAFLSIWQIVLKVDDWLNVGKMLLALFCLTGAACVDYRECRIPNIFPLVLALGGIISLVLGFVTNQEGAIAYVVSSAFATAVCAVGLAVMAYLTKNGIGFGDIKLLCALAIVGGVYVICGTLFFSVLICSLIALFLMIRKKKDVKSSVPFGPFILLGYILTIFIIGF